MAATTDSNMSESTEAGTGRLKASPLPTIRKSARPSRSLSRLQVSRLTTTDLIRVRSPSSDSGKGVKQPLADDEPQDGVAEKLEPLVGGQPVPGPRGVRHRRHAAGLGRETRARSAAGRSRRRVPDRAGPVRGRWPWREIHLLCGKTTRFWPRRCQREEPAGTGRPNLLDGRLRRMGCCTAVASAGGPPGARPWMPRPWPASARYNRVLA